MYIYVYVYMCVCECVCVIITFLCIYTCMCVCVFVCLYILVCIPILMQYYRYFIHSHYFNTKRSSKHYLYIIIIMIVYLPSKTWLMNYN